jgi:hypothetical protein
METASQMQPALEKGQIATIISFERSEEVVELFRHQFPEHAVSAVIDHTVMLLVYPPLTEQEQHLWRRTLTTHYTHDALDVEDAPLADR